MDFLTDLIDVSCLETYETLKSLTLSHSQELDAYTDAYTGDPKFDATQAFQGN